MPISVDPPETSRELKERLGLGLELYSDPGGALARAFGVFDADTEIAIVSSFAIRRGGAITYKFVGADKTDRPTIDALLEASKPAKTP